MHNGCQHAAFNAGAKTLAGHLKPSGYATAAFGKWHLGDNGRGGTTDTHHPTKHGFDESWGYSDYSAASKADAQGFPVPLRPAPAATRKLYGLDQPETAGYGTRCLMARRLIEAGVRYVQVFPPLKPSFQPWDNHSELKSGLKTICGHVDQPSAALILDLKQRGLLEEVIVMWTGEFGRLPITEGTDGRDHNRHAFSLLMAGGGFKRGHIHGATDEFGYRSVQDRVSVPDLHATILNQLGLDHERLSYLHNGRPERLTDPEVTGAQIVRNILA